VSNAEHMAGTAGVPNLDNLAGPERERRTCLCCGKRRKCRFLLRLREWFCTPVLRRWPPSGRLMSRRHRRDPNKIRARRLANAQKHAPRIVVGENVVAVPVGLEPYVAPMAQLPPKRPGKHRWVASVAYVMSERAVSNARNPDITKLLDHENLLNIAIGCFDCEQVLGAISAYGRCEAWVEPEADGA
jgi:hypothetical protein